MLSMALTFSGLMFVYYRGNMQGENFGTNVLVYSLWIIGFYLLADMSWKLIDEMQSGTIEQLYMSSLPSLYIWGARMISSLIIASCNAIGILCIISLCFGVSLPLYSAVLVTFLCTLPGLCGLAFFLGGLTLRIKKTEALVGFMYNICLYLGGTIVPLELFPEKLRTFAYFVPAAPGIDLIRTIAQEKLTLGSVFCDYRIYGVLVHALCLFLIGVLFFSWCEKSLRKNGNYGIY